ncbi:Imm1 family immunity protein [Micromonospora aurantiaca (nom. illeg.)]|uniref:Imm1 family immunity protein n=1 Tax=Micromonospora aurantiaca (nom. illeg.) TaxID=47850 RepID=UPI0008285877|nr:Imm1 family immunity protein [Micromonospora aurantiaca]SCL35862.1 Immunity protein Imm1 [Micromonospora aurantiaca]
MKVTWTYDRGDHRDNHEVDLADPDVLEALLREIQQAGEPVVVTIFSDITDDPDDLPPGVQIGLGHRTHAFAVHIADDGGYLNDPTVPPPDQELHFDLGGVPTEYPTEHLRLRPETAIQVAGTFLKTGGTPPHLPAASE